MSYLALADGTVWPGESVGADGYALGEAVFTTGMSGYQEAVTDPSFEDQLICFTAPMVGNYGVAEERSESARTHARAVLMREARGPEWTDWLRERGVVALTGIDTRSLVLHLRDAGSALGIAVASDLPVEKAVELAAQQPPMLGRALIDDVSTDEPYVFAADGRVRVAVGAPANLVLLDLEREWTVGEQPFRSRSGNSWLLGSTLNGTVQLTVAGGGVVHE